MLVPFEILRIIENYTLDQLTDLELFLLDPASFLRKFKIAVPVKSDLEKLYNNVLKELLNNISEYHSVYPRFMNIFSIILKTNPYTEFGKKVKNWVKSKRVEEISPEDMQILFNTSSLETYSSEQHLIEIQILVILIINHSKYYQLLAEEVEDLETEATLKYVLNGFIESLKYLYNRFGFELYIPKEILQSIFDNFKRQYDTPLMSFTRELN